MNKRIATDKTRTTADNQSIENNPHYVQSEKPDTSETEYSSVKEVFQIVEEKLNKHYGTSFKLRYK